MGYKELLDYVNNINKCDSIFIIKKTNASKTKGKEFVCTVNPDEKFKYVLLYISVLNLWLCWKRREKRIEKYNVQKKDVICKAENGFLYKGKEYKAWGEEKVLIINPKEIKNLIESIINK